MMQTDVKSAYVDSATTVYAAPTRVKGIYIYVGSGAGTLELSDGATGTVLLKMATPASSTGNPFYIPVPGEGIKFNTSVYAKTMTNVASITVFYG
jgi:hypothetical protein